MEISSIGRRYESPLKEDLVGFVLLLPPEKVFGFVFFSVSRYSFDYFSSSFDVRSRRPPKAEMVWDNGGGGKRGILKSNEWMGLRGKPKNRKREGRWGYF